MTTLSQSSQRSCPFKVYEASENSEVEIPLSSLIGEGELQLIEDSVGKNLYRIYLKKNRLVFQAGSGVGLIPVTPSIAIDVRPRVPIRNIGRILDVSGSSPMVLQSIRVFYQRDASPTASLLNVIADSLLREVETIENTGIRRQYIHSTRTTSFPRGRLILSSVLHYRATGRNHLVEVSAFDFTANNPLNQLIKTALWCLARYYGRMEGSENRRYRRRIRDALRSFAAPTVDETLQIHLHPLVQRLQVEQAHTPYERAVVLAHTIISGGGADASGRTGRIPLPSLVLDLEDAFEKYVRAVLLKSLAGNRLAIKNGAKAPPHGANTSLFAGETACPSMTVSPDVVTEVDGRVRVVGEVKYVPAQKCPDRSHVEQLVTYLAAYGCDSGVLVYPAAEESAKGLLRIGAVANKAVYQYSMWLGASDLAAEEDSLSAAFKGLIDDDEQTVKPH